MGADIVGTGEAVGLASELVLVETREQLDSLLMRSLYLGPDEYRHSTDALSQFYDGLELETSLDKYRASLGLALGCAKMIGDTYFTDQPEEEYMPGIVVFSNMALWEAIGQNMEPVQLSGSIHGALMAFFEDADGRQERIQSARAAIEMEVLRHANDDLPVSHDEEFTAQAQATQDIELIPKNNPKPKRKLASISADWQLAAKCRDKDVSFFYPEDGKGTTRARKYCDDCDVKEACLEYALEYGERFGVWGGESERSRRKILKMRAKS